MRKSYFVVGSILSGLWDQKLHQYIDWEQIFYIEGRSNFESGFVLMGKRENAVKCSFIAELNPMLIVIKECIIRKLAVVDNVVFL